MTAERRRATPSRLVLAAALGGGLAAALAGVHGVAAQAQENGGAGADVGADVGGVSGDVGADIGGGGVGAHAGADIGGGNGNGGPGNNGNGHGGGGHGNGHGGGGHGNGHGGGNGGGGQSDSGSGTDNSSGGTDSGTSNSGDAAGSADAAADDGPASSGGSQATASDFGGDSRGSSVGNPSHGAKSAPGTPAASAVEARYRYFLSMNTDTPEFRRYARAAENDELAAAGKALGKATFRPVTVDLVDYVNQQLGVRTALTSPQIVAVANASSPFKRANEIAGAADALIEGAAGQ